MEWVLLVGAPAGVALIVALVWLLGGWTDAPLADAEAVRARYLDDDPLFEPGDVLLSADGRAAVVMSKDGGRAAVVRGLGDRQVTRPLEGGLLRAAVLEDTRDGRTLLRLGLADPTCRRAVLDVSALDEGARQAWLARLDGFLPQARTASAAA